MTSVIGQGPLVEGRIGFETVARSALIVLIENLNDQLVIESEAWKQADLEWQTLTGGTLGQIDLEPVQPNNFHEGPHRSLLEAPPDAFPNVSVSSALVVPDTEQLDQIDISSMRMYVEIMVKAGPIPDGSVNPDFETMTHRRCERTTEAVNAVLMHNFHLITQGQPQGQIPRGGLTPQAWVKREKGGGPRYLWQGSRLEYTLQRHSMF